MNWDSPARTWAASTGCAAAAPSCSMARRSAPACMFAVQADGHELTTVEGLAPAPGQLHPLQEAFSQEHALQCGFCTPGFLMTLIPFLETNPGSLRARDSPGPLR